jgi:hypothetical protein
MPDVGEVGPRWLRVGLGVNKVYPKWFGMYVVEEVCPKWSQCD